MDEICERNKQLVRDLWSAIEKQRFGAIQALYDPDVVYHGPYDTELRGFFQIAGLLRSFDTALPGHEIEMGELHAQGNLVVSRIKVTWHLADGQHRAARTPYARSYWFINTVRVVNSRIVEEWAAYGPLDILRLDGRAAAA